jgi:hypothetical protein
MTLMRVLLLVSQQVKDYDEWKAQYLGNHRMREEAGLVERFVGQDAKKLNVAHVGLEAPSLEAANRFLSNPALLTVMSAAGVANAPDIRFVFLD